MRKFIKRILNPIGLWIEEENKLRYTFEREKYVVTDNDRIAAHKQLLQSLEKKEDERLEVIDKKTSQLITYTGVIFSALSLFIPILLEKITVTNMTVKIVLVIVLTLAFVFYVLTIHNAARNYNSSKFWYSRSTPLMVIDEQEKTVAEFTKSEVLDLILGYDYSLRANNEKASNLIYAYRTFRIANIFTAIIGIAICFSLLFSKQKEDTGSIRMQHLDSLATEYLKIVKEQK